MRIIVLGAGISGILSAYYLGKAGHKVTVIDRQKEAAQECSYANGGQLSYSHAEPWANPHVFPKLFKWMGQDDAPLVLKFSRDPQMIKWGLSFLANCAPNKAERHAKALLKIGLHSRNKMKEIRKDTGIHFNWQDKGILHIYTDPKEFDVAIKQANIQQQWGCKQEIFSYQECIAKEPTLEHSCEEIHGGIFSPMDESGDIHIFTQKLAQHVETRFHAKMMYGTEIQAIHRTGDTIESIDTSKGNLKADAYVMCMGADTPLMMRKIGLKVPIYPMKGYSITLPADEYSPNVSITDDARKIVYSRLGDVVRVAGTAEFAGYNKDVNPARIEPIKRGIKSLFPHANLNQPKEWACLRPSTPDGPPIVGRTKLQNLYMNTGHGTLGWTQGAGTANLLASVIGDETPEISLEGLNMRRYGLL